MPLTKSVIGMVLIGGAAFGLTKAMVFPGFLALLPTLGAFLLLSAGLESGFNRVILAHPLMIWVGLISYPLYLWHWPLLVIARSMGLVNREVKVVLVLVSFVLAWLTYRFVEKPLRRYKNDSVKVGTLVIGMACLGAAGFGTFLYGGLPSRFPHIIQHIIPAVNFFEKHIGPRWRRHHCFLEEEDAVVFDGDCFDFGHQGRPMIFLWGDSHAAALSPGFVELQKKKSLRFIQLTASTCSPILDGKRRDGRRCDTINEIVSRHITALMPDMLIIHAQWVFYKNFAPGLEETIVSLKKLGIKKIVLVGPVPRWPKKLAQSLVAFFKQDPFHRVPEKMKFGLWAGNEAIDKQLRDIAARASIHYASPLDILCDKTGCQTLIGGSELTTFDTVHLTPAAANFLVQRIYDSL